MQYDFNLRPVDFVGQYMRGKTFREDMEERKRKKADRAELEQLQEAARREKALIQDARTLKYYLEDGSFNSAQDLALTRLQKLTDMGADTSDTEQVAGKLVSGDFQGALGDVNAFLAGVGKLQEKSKAEKSEPLHDNIKIGEGGELIGRNRETGVFEVIPSEVKARGATPQVQVGSSESAYDKEIAKYDAEVFKSLKEQKREAGKSNRALSRMSKLNDEALSGAGSGLKQTV